MTDDEVDRANRRRERDERIIRKHRRRMIAELGE